MRFHSCSAVQPGDASVFGSTTDSATSTTSKATAVEDKLKLRLGTCDPCQVQVSQLLCAGNLSVCPKRVQVAAQDKKLRPILYMFLVAVAL